MLNMKRLRQLVRFRLDNVAHVDFQGKPISLNNSFHQLLFCEVACRDTELAYLTKRNEWRSYSALFERGNSGRDKICPLDLLSICSRRYIVRCWFVLFQESYGFNGWIGAKERINGRN